MKANTQAQGLKRFSVKATFMVAAYAATAILSIPAFGGDDRHGPDTSGLDTRMVLAQSTTELQISLANLKCSYEVMNALQQTVYPRVMAPQKIAQSPSGILLAVWPMPVGSAKTKDGRSVGNSQLPIVLERNRDGYPLGPRFQVDKLTKVALISVLQSDQTGDTLDFEAEGTEKFPEILYDRYVDKLKLDGLGRILEIEERTIFRGFSKANGPQKLYRIERGEESGRFETALTLDIEGFKACIISELSK